jgi:hypothetical protein
MITCKNTSILYDDDQNLSLADGCLPKYSYNIIYHYGINNLLNEN